MKNKFIFKDLSIKDVTLYKYNFKRFHSSLDYRKPMNVYLEYLKSVG